MFVLVHKSRVVVGPIGWNRAMFDGNLEKLKIRALLPRVAPDVFPIVIDADTKICRAEQNYPSLNGLIEYQEGPYWNTDGDVAIANYEVRQKPIDSVKAKLKEDLAAVRWSKEVAGTKVLIQGNEYTLDTSRGNREVFVQKYLLMSDTESVIWKFPEGWVTLSKTELGDVVRAGAKHVEDCFAWEATKVTELEFFETHEDLATFNVNG